jgi:hypothetical protein
MEILILTMGLIAFFEQDLKDIFTTKNVKKINIKTQFVFSEVGINQKNQFEIINKNGTWMLAPIQKNKSKSAMQAKGSRFITLPDGSKIEKGI